MFKLAGSSLHNSIDKAQKGVYAWSAPQNGKRIRVGTTDSSIAKPETPNGRDKVTHDNVTGAYRIPNGKAWQIGGRANQVDKIVSTME